MSSYYYHQSISHYFGLDHVSRPCHGIVHISVTKWWTVEYLFQSLRDLWDGFLVLLWKDFFSRGMGRSYNHITAEMNTHRVIIDKCFIDRQELTLKQQNISIAMVGFSLSRANEHSFQIIDYTQWKKNKHYKVHIYTPCISRKFFFMYLFAIRP